MKSPPLVGFIILCITGTSQHCSACVRSPAYARRTHKPLCGTSISTSSTSTSNATTKHEQPPGAPPPQPSFHANSGVATNSTGGRAQALEAGRELANRFHSEACLRARSKARFDGVLGGVVGHHWQTQEVLLINQPKHLSQELLLDHRGSHRRALAYIRNQKVASTMFWNHAREYAGGDAGHVARWPFRRAASFKAGGGPAAAASYDGHRIFFTFVREPISAFISGFMQDMCFVKHTMRGSDMDRDAGASLKAALGQNPLIWRNGSEAFRLFLADYQRGHFLSNAASHVWPQADKLDVGGVRFEFIGRVETFGASMAALFPGGRVPAHGHKADDDACKVNIMKTFHVGAAEKRLLCEILEVEFVCLGYERPPECR